MEKVLDQCNLKTTPRRLSSKRSFDLDDSMLVEYVSAIENLIYHDDVMVSKEIIKEIRKVADNFGEGSYIHLDKLTLECDERLKFARNQRPDDYAERGNHYNPKSIPRLVIAENIISDYMEKNPGSKSFLDLGCNQGDFSFLMATKFPTLKVHGVDYSISCVKEATNAFANQLEKGRLSFKKMSAEKVEGKYDIVFAGELMEHVEDAQAFISKLESLCNPMGLIVITTPSGPWEAIGVRLNSKFRSHHLHHFEEDDLKELFGTKYKARFLFSPAGCSDLGEPLGNWVTSWINKEGERYQTGLVNCERKLKDNIF